MSRRNLVILAALGVTALLAAAWLPRSLRVANAGRLARAALVEAITASDLPGVYALGRAVPGVPPDLARARLLKSRNRLATAVYRGSIWARWATRRWRRLR